MQAISQSGEIEDQGKIQKIVKRFGMNEIDLKTAYAGDIVSISGITQGTVGHTIN